jgi:ABC-type Fe3+/spermidine/putrescine transport system ATPase subunit
LTATVAPGGVRAGDTVIAADVGDLAVGTAVSWCVRPERVSLSARLDEGYPATVIDIADLGATSALTVRLAGGPELRARVADLADRHLGDACALRIDRAAINVWPERPDAPDGADRKGTIP